MDDFNDLIILSLDLVAHDHAQAQFRGAEERHADGFSIAVPAREWEALGRPSSIEFIVSTKRLGVRGGWVVRG